MTGWFGSLTRDFEFAVFVMAVRATAHEFAVIFRPIFPIVPNRRMHQQQTMA